jgi:type VI secretion system protein
MSLSLVLTISNNPSGHDNTCVFDETGGSIGRNPDNDFVLPDPNHFLSRKHALISYQDGAYYLTDISENGVYLNNSDISVGKNNTVRLKHGDCLGVGEHEIDVSIEQTEHVSSQQPYETGPVSIDSGPARSPWELAGNHQTSPGILDGSRQPAEIPEFSNRNSEAARGDSVMQPAAEPNHSAAEQDFFMPPSTHDENAPLDWDETGFAPSADAESQSPDWDKTDFIAPVRPEERVPPGRDINDHKDVHASPGRSKQEKAGAVTGDALSSEYDSEEAAHISSAVGPVPVSTDIKSSAEATTVGVEALQAFLHGAGLNTEQLSPESAEALMKLQGKLYREIVQGLMEVLRARFDLKNEFRMHQTQIQARENNPLKFIGQVDDALEYLVLKRSPGFLTPEAAFHEAFQDIKDHQVAMVVGMRAAFESLLRRFNPEQLEPRFTRGSKIGNLLPLNRKASCWEHYQEWYADISAAAEDDFQGLFGNEFTRAYEEQMARLSLLRRKPDK